MQEKTIDAIVALAGVRWLQAEQISVVVAPKGTILPTKGHLPEWDTWEAQVRLGGGKWGDLVGEGKAPEAALGNLLEGLIAAHKAVDERRETVLKAVPWSKRGATPQQEAEERTRVNTLTQAIHLVAKTNSEAALDILQRLLTQEIPADKAPTDPVGNTRAQHEADAEADEWLGNLAQTLGLIGSEASSRAAILERASEVVELLTSKESDAEARRRRWEQADHQSWLHNLATALGVSHEDKAAILARAWEVGGTRRP